VKALSDKICCVPDTFSGIQLPMIQPFRTCRSKKAEIVFDRRGGFSFVSVMYIPPDQALQATAKRAQTHPRTDASTASLEGT
jgi:hypothetical protein